MNFVENDKYLLIELDTGIDIYNASSIRAKIFPLIEKTDKEIIVVSLKNVPRIDSAGIGMLVKVNNEILSKNKTFYIVEYNDIIERIFRNTALFEHLNIYATLEEVEKII